MLETTFKVEKKNYKAVWNVLNDVDELTNAEFFVKIELKEDGSKLETTKKIGGFNVFKSEKDNKGHFFVAAQTFGGKVGYMGNWGGALSVGVDAIDFEFSLLGSVSKSIVKKQNFQWNISVLAGIHDTYYDNGYFDEYSGEYFYDDYYSIGLAYGLGTDVAIGHLYLNFDNYLDTQAWYHIMAGIGWRF